MAKHGAVSSQTVTEMAFGALKNSTAKCAIAITGIAGPEGGGDEKPVGTVWVAVAADRCLSKCCHFEGDRTQVREQAVLEALQMGCTFL